MKSDRRLIIHPKGLIYVGLGVGISFLASLWFWPVAVITAVITAWCAYFFRDPVRRTTAMPGMITAPADGLIIAVDRQKPLAELGLKKPMARISIFMNIFDVHVNRMPIKGKVIGRHYRAGKFFNASFDKASVDNERLAIHLRTAKGHDCICIQIAGLVARRIACWLVDGQNYRAGHRLGMIYFGSRVDLYVPVDSDLWATVGQRVRAGESVLGKLS